MHVKPEQGNVVLYWTYYDGREGGRRGHAYLHCEGDRAHFFLYEHSSGGAAKEVMMARHERWQRAHPASPEQELRRRASWRDPSNSWSIAGDLGEAQAALRNRSMETHLAPGVAPLPPMPEAFLRRPMGSLVRAKAGHVLWPEVWEASTISPGLAGPLVLRAGSTVIVCAARYGSRFADSGQDRTAAIWRSEDGGLRWTELPWRLGLLSRISPSGRWNWPPEQVRKLCSADPLTIEWHDPWIDWEPGTEWRASFDLAKGQWKMKARS